MSSDTDSGAKGTRARTTHLWLAILAVAVSSAGCSVSTELIPTTTQDLQASEGIDLRVAMQDEMRIMNDAGVLKQSLIDNRPAVDQDVTVAEFYRQIGASVPEYGAALDRAEEATDRLESMLETALAFGHGADLIVDPGLIREMIAEFRLWIEAERYQNDPNMCRHTFPAGSDDKQLTEVFPDEWEECFSDFISDPRVQRGSFQAAARVLEIGAVIGQAWSD